MIPETLFSLQGRTALVTGSSRGIGKATAMLLGQAGARVIFHASRESDRLDSALQEAGEAGIQCRAVTGDLGDADATADIIRACGDVDLLILNASRQQYMTIEDYDDREADLEYRVNVRASCLLIQGFLPGMKERKFGRIVTIGSVNQFHPAPRLSLYGSTKAALLNLTCSTARSCGPYGITANNVAPGVINTDRNREALANAETAAGLIDRIPVRRFGTPGDCAGAVLLLCSEAGSYINGAVITVDGGMTL